MDPISVAMLSALAGGAGGELGRQAWSSLGALVRRPFRRGEREPAVVEGRVVSGEAEMAELERNPADVTLARNLYDVLMARSATDAEFGSALERWTHTAAPLTGEVHNEISGGTQYGPVLQGQSFSGLSFTVSGNPPGADGPRGADRAAGESPTDENR